MTIGAAARFIVLILALINQWLATKNISPIPVDEDGISSILLTIVALYTAYKDNPVTKKGHQANIEMKQKKLDKKQGANGKAPIDIQDNEGQI
ncbi:phage holin [Staphylococcus gallinarum]|uniref:phage holin n=1 Tax=Staphylococcus gallinarum TaxID=1293 RepID=UPI000D1D8290|nr:phage holin [Staphylococcus gallinarum]PTK96022.1 phage holin [Staphylococcus gallinarum]RIO88477.1 phage holin [Staphylococcus gallinarum]